jgi:DNA replication protein DnaC
MTIAPLTTDRIHLAASLKKLQLSGMLESLDNRLHQASDGQFGFLDFLQALCLDEINRRQTAALQRRTHTARFEMDGRFENFDFTIDSGIPAAKIRDLAATDWVGQGRHLIIYGPVGAGKTHMATAFGHRSIQAGLTCRFITTSRLLGDLAGGHADGSWDKRVQAYTKPNLLILDDFAMREFTAPQADDLYEVVSRRTNRSIIVTTNRAPADWYPLFPNAVVAESLLDRLIGGAHQLKITAPSWRSKQHPTPTDTTNLAQQEKE